MALAAATMPPMTEFYLTTLWAYKPKTVEKVIDEMNQMGFEDAEFIYDRHYYWFLVTCREDQAKEIRQQFANLTHDIEEDAFRGHDQDFLNSDCGLNASFDTEWFSQNRSNELSGADWPKMRYCVPDSLSGYSWHGPWDELDSDTEPLKVADILTADQFEQLKKTLDVEMSVVLAGRLVHIATNREDAIHKARHKLSCLATAKRARMKPLRAQHILYAEDYVDPVRPGVEAYYEFTADIRYLVNIDPGLPSSTLLDRATVSDLAETYKKIYREACSIRLCPWSFETDQHVPLLGPKVVVRPKAKTILKPRPRTFVEKDDSGGQGENNTNSTVIPINGRGRETLVLPVRPATAMGSTGTQTAKGTTKAKQQAQLPKPNFRPETQPGSAEKPLFTRECGIDIEVAMRRLLDQAHWHRGMFAVRAELGRIILDAVDITAVAFNNERMPSDGWHNACLVNQLNKFYGDNEDIHFTNILSTYACDIRDMINVTRNGARIWQEDHSRAWTTYSFRCMSSAAGTAGLFFVDIVDDGSETGKFTYSIRPGNDAPSRHKPRTIYIHAIRRHWDLRIIASHVETDEVEAAYGDFARALLQSLRVCRNRQGAMELRFAVDSEATASVEEVRVLTKWRHQSLDKGAALEITEVLQLEMHDYNDGANCDSWDARQVVAARAWSEEKTKEAQASGEVPRWYEAAVVSLELEKVFEANSTMQLGCGAGWDGQVLSQAGFFATLYNPALHLLRAMDHVGRLDNNNLAKRCRSSSLRRNDPLPVVPGLAGPGRRRGAGNSSLTGN